MNNQQEYAPKSFQEKNITVTLVNFSLILIYFSIRVIVLLLNNNFTTDKISRLFGIVVLAGVVVTIFATILTHIISAIIQAIRIQGEPDIESVTDERDEWIKLKGSKLSSTLYSFGTFVAMTTFILDQPALVMFTLLIFFGLVAQVIGDAYQLSLYRKGL